MMTRLELIRQHKEAFEAFAKAGIDPTRHIAYLDLYRERQKHSATKRVANKYNCSTSTVRRAVRFLNTDL